jgi:hypothetical protein
VIKKLFGLDKNVKKGPTTKQNLKKRKAKNTKPSLP